MVRELVAEDRGLAQSSGQAPRQRRPNQKYACTSRFQGGKNVFLPNWGCKASSDALADSNTEAQERSKASRGIRALHFT